VGVFIKRLGGKYGSNMATIKAANSLEKGEEN
jgi:hypothetical protein